MVYMGMRSRIKNLTRIMASTQMHAEYQKGPSELWAPPTELGRRTDTDIKDTMTKMFGDKVQIIPTMSHDLDARHELSHSTTGLKYAIRGRAQVIEQTVGSRLAAFEDPIKAIMPVQVVDAHRVIVTTKEVVGGRSIVAPERAPARTVGIKETTREVMLERYGADLEMNLNLQHEPALFKEEFDLKLAAQQRELERVLVELGYDEIMRTGLRLDAAIQRSLPAYNGTLGGLTYDRAVREAERIYHKNCFGIMNKQRFPLHSILSAAKYATAYGIGQPGSVMILPHGMPEMLDYTRPEKMEFKISGLKTTDGKPITMDLGTSHTDSATNIKMLVHIPQPTFEYGSANPRVGPGCLDNVVDVLQFIVVPGGGTGGNARAGLGADARNNCNANGMVSYEKVQSIVAQGAAVSFVNNTGADTLTGDTNTSMTDLLTALVYARYNDKISTGANAYVVEGVTNANAFTATPVQTLANAVGSDGNNNHFLVIGGDNKTNGQAAKKAALKDHIETLYAAIKAEVDGRSTPQRPGEAISLYLEAGKKLATYCDQRFFERLGAQSNTGLYRMSMVEDNGIGGVSRDVAFVDMSSGAEVNTKTIRTDAANKRTNPRLLVRKLRLTTQSAILAAPGADTGSLMVGMPHTAVSTSQTDESLKMQLRVYLGAVVKQPESVVIIPDVSITGHASSYKNNLTEAIQDPPESGDDFLEAFDEWIQNSGDESTEFISVPLSVDAAGEALLPGFVSVEAQPNDGSTKLEGLAARTDIRIGNHMVYRASCITTNPADNSEVTTGATGHLKDLDDIQNPKAVDEKFGAGGPGFRVYERKTF